VHFAGIVRAAAFIGPGQQPVKQATVQAAVLLKIQFLVL
jgi:hypothetical protein